MFLLRSAFWLFLAFMVIKPGVDINAAAASLSSQAMQQGQKLIVEQIAATECGNLQCIGGKAVLAAAIAPSPPVGITMGDSPAPASVPLPRPRPNWAG